MAATNDGLDEAGFIRQVPRVPFQAEYSAVLTAVSRQLPALLGAHLVALYVYGSVAEGRGRPGQSDLDLTLILSDACPAEALEALEQLRRVLEHQHPAVSKIDFDIGRRAEALAAANRYSWGYWLKHQCRWLWGEDLARGFAPFRPEVAIVRAVNGEVLPLLRCFVPAIATCMVAAERLSVQREAARRLLRALHLLRRPEETGWPWSLADHLARALRLHPEQRSALEFFYREALQPQATATDFVPRLAAFLPWFERQLDRAEY
ncbi:hypothetical protein NS383_01790 [Pseudomonas oryzihabitans]|nr:hypothetical protein NS383_01790 [Pseudomonas psychrotolerans]